MNRGGKTVERTRPPNSSTTLKSVQSVKNRMNIE
jgi:hypothetical protein